jgi:poly(hydroxyalkanoate) depolymerase family esterase
MRRLLGSASAWAHILVLIVPLSAVHPTAAQELLEVSAFGPNPGNLRMFAHQLSARFDSSAARPLVVVLHGCGQTAEGFAAHSGWNELADREGFHVIYPQQRTSNNVSRCFNWFREKDITRGSGEVASINSMVLYAVNNWNVDTARIHIMGASAGAAMAVVAGACYPDVFATVASFAGGPYKCATTALDAMREMTDPSQLDVAEQAALVAASNANAGRERYPRMVILHGLKDHTVDPSNAQALVDQWTGVHGIDNVPDTTDIAFLGYPNVERRVYTNGSGVSQVVLYRFNDLGHMLPVDPGEGPSHGGRTGTFFTDRDVHGCYIIAREFGLLP